MTIKNAKKIIELQNEIIDMIMSYETLNPENVECDCCDCLDCDKKTDIGKYYELRWEIRKLEKGDE